MYLLHNTDLVLLVHVYARYMYIEWPCHLLSSVPFSCNSGKFIPSHQQFEMKILLQLSITKKHCPQHCMGIYMYAVS